MDTFRSCDLKLQTVAVLWTLFGVVEIPSQNCKPWQFYGHFSEFSKSVHTTANGGSSMDTALYLHTSQVSHKSHANLTQITCKSQANLVRISFKSQGNVRQTSGKCFKNLKQISDISGISQAYIR